MSLPLVSTFWVLIESLETCNYWLIWGSSKDEVKPLGKTFKNHKNMSNYNIIPYVKDEGVNQNWDPKSWD